ncbi:MAG TPA: 2-hydroxyacyl-CoA dehydratase family protein [Anaeromyxobacteraceae bacterium]|nr:2-hydroxyacyl-CoA dehydratase family protein [Anaeromyxobacteraceae bacterium]
MTRNEYIARQRQAHGRLSLAVLPVHYPKELLTALDVLAVELWGPPGPPRGDGAGRLQSYVCALARNALAFLAAGKAEAVDGVLFPHTCDTIQGLAALARELGGFGKAIFTFLHPKGPPRPSARAYLEAELRALAGELERFTGRALRPERLRAAMRLHREIDRRRALLLDERRRVALSDSALYELLRRGEWLWPEDHLAELRAAAGALAPTPVQEGVPLLATGYVPEPAGLFGALEEAGAYLAADDYAAVGRRLSRPREDRGDEGDPLRLLAEAYFDAPPCPTRSADSRGRMRYLEGLLERSGSRGVLVHVQKFCEPELFDLPALRSTFAARGVPLLVLEGELEAKLPAPAVTRIEAFVEMLTAGRGA